jgi:Flp pilus assembly protein TadG
MSVSPPASLGALRNDDRGATLIEFAFVAPVMLLMLMGFFDLAHQAYAQSVLTGAVNKAARDATLEGGGDAGVELDNKVATQVRLVTGERATFTPVRLSYTDFRGVGTAERFTDAGAPGNNRYDRGECFFDTNGNGVWDSDIGRSGQGGAQDAVLYRVTVSYPRLFPMPRMLGWSGTQEISASTVLRNQPYADQVVPVVSCRA